MPGLSFKYPASALVGASGADVTPDESNLLLGQLNSTEVMGDEYRFEAGAALPVPCRASVVRVRYAYCHTHPPAVSLLPLAHSTIHVLFAPMARCAALMDSNTRHAPPDMGRPQTARFLAVSTRGSFLVWLERCCTLVAHLRLHARLSFVFWLMWSTVCSGVGDSPWKAVQIMRATLSPLYIAYRMYFFAMGVRGTLCRPHKRDATRP